jgi:hypothetical protein
MLQRKDLKRSEAHWTILIFDDLHNISQLDQIDAPSPLNNGEIDVTGGVSIL